MEIEDDSPRDDADEADIEMSPREDQFNELRIKQVASLRRATYRSRSYAIIAAVVCAVAVVQLLVSAWRLIRASGFTITPIMCVLFVPICVIGAAFFFRRACALHRELQKQVIAPEPPTPPDFSTLSDGSQQWENLENIR